MPRTAVAPHRTQTAGTGHASNPARARCTTCGWESERFYGLAGQARAMMASTAHKRCPECDGTRHRPGGAPCDACAGSGFRP